MTDKTEWQPIATAPHGVPLLGEDGPFIRVRWQCGQTGIAHFGQGPYPIGPRWQDKQGRACSTPIEWATDEPASQS
ncbi:MAG TPA: hypothetical protein V6C81_18410 [Planktothrix sp.]